MAFFKFLSLMTVTSSHVAFAATPACANEEGMGYNDTENQLPSLFLDDAQACQDACIAACHVFTFYPKNIWHPNSTLGGCFLQGDAAKLMKFEGAISGPKSCDTTTTPGVETTPVAAAAVVETTAAAAAAATTPEPAPTSAEEAAEQALGKLHPYAPLGLKANAAAGAAASFAFAEGKSKQVVAEVAEKAAKTILVDANSTTHQIMVNHMATAVGKVFANQTIFNMTDQEAADRTQKSVHTFADEIYDKPEAALAAVSAAGASISVGTGAFPTPIKTTAAPEEATAAPEETTTEAAAASKENSSVPVATRDITLPDEEQKPEDKSEGIPPWVWILVALAVLACLAGAYMFLCTGSSKDKKKKTKKTAPKDLEAAPLLKEVQEAPAASTSVYSAPAAAAAPRGLPAASFAQGTVLSQGSPMYSTTAGGFALPQGSPVSGSSMVMMPQAAPAVTVAPPVYVGQAQPMMMQGGMSVASQPFAQAPMMGAQPAGSSAAMDLFNRLDANGDGQLSAQEFAQLQAMRQ